MTCPDCLRRSVILRAIKRLSPRSSTAATQAATEAVARAGCGCAAETPPRRTNVSGRAPEAAPTSCPDSASGRCGRPEVPSARTERQP